MLRPKLTWRVICKIAGNLSEKTENVDEVVQLLDKSYYC